MAMFVTEGCNQLSSLLATTSKFVELALARLPRWPKREVVPSVVFMVAALSIL